MRLRRLILPLAVGAIALVPTASAHVTLQPTTAVAGSFTVLDVRVPNERDNADTTKVDMRIPDGFVSVSYQPVPGWSVRVIEKKLAQPVQTDDGPVDREVSEIVWTGDGKQGKIAPGQFQDFPLSVAIPDKPGTKLTFPALQTYSNGEIVRWIGPPGNDQPAPRVTITAAADKGAPAGAQETAATAPASADSGDGRDGLTLGLAVAGLVLGALALLLVLFRKARSS